MVRKRAVPRRVRGGGPAKEKVSDPREKVERKNLYSRQKKLRQSRGEGIRFTAENTGKVRTA